MSVGGEHCPEVLFFSFSFFFLFSFLNNALCKYNFVAASQSILQLFLSVFSCNTHACKHRYIHYICSILHTLNLNVLKCVLDYLIKCCGIRVKKELNYITSHQKTVDIIILRRSDWIIKFYLLLLQRSWDYKKTMYLSSPPSRFLWFYWKLDQENKGLGSPIH